MQAGSAVPTLLVALAVCYVIVLLALPSDVGVRALGVVLTPSRLLLGGLLVVAVLSRRLSLSTIREEPRTVLLGWLAFLAAATATTVVHSSNAGVARLLSMAFEGLVLYLVVRAAARDRRSVEVVIGALVGVTVAVVVLSIIVGSFGWRYDSLGQYLLGAASTGNASGERFGLVRQQGPFPAALFLAVWIASCSALVLPWTRPWTTRLGIAATLVWLVLVAGVLVLTVSRIALTGALLAAGAYGLLRGRRVLGASLVVVGVIVAIGFAGLSIGTSPNEPAASPEVSSAPASAVGGRGSPGIGSTARPGDASRPPGGDAGYPSESDILAGSNALRVQALRAGLDAVARAPVLGWGLLSAKEVVSAAGGQVNYVDSSYLVLAVELGLLGAATFVFLVVAVALAARPALRSDLGVAVALALIVMMGCSVVAAYLSITQGYASMSLLAALLISLATDARERRPSDPVSRPHRPGPDGQAVG